MRFHWISKINRFLSGFRCPDHDSFQSGSETGWLLGTSRLISARMLALVFLMPLLSRADVVFTSLASLDGTNGSIPWAGVTQGRDGIIYGVASQGGEKGFGTVFNVTAEGQIHQLASFRGTNGANPHGRLIQGRDGYFYGTTVSGGPVASVDQGESSQPGSLGTVFRVSAGGELKMLFDFSPVNGVFAYGESPYAGLVEGLDGEFYGAASAGISPLINGLVFRMTPDGAMTKLFTFPYFSGSPPLGGNVTGTLTQAPNGLLYGTTLAGGPGGSGTVFSLTTNGVFTQLAAFNSSSGSFLYSGVTLGSAGNLYGVTDFGGSGPNTLDYPGNGTVFKVSTNGVLTSLVSFDGSNGNLPYGGLALGPDGDLYGTTESGPDGFGGSIVGGYGSVFKITPEGELTTLHVFDGNDGSFPEGTLSFGMDGNLYGTTGRGGRFGFGTVFRISFSLPPAGIVMTIRSYGAGLEVNWNATPGSAYQLQSTTDLSGITWVNLGPVTVAASSVVSLSDLPLPDGQRFYRVVSLP